LLFFRGAGVPEVLYKDIHKQLDSDRDSVNKYEICRSILVKLNEKKDLYIRERRELLKRVVEFESFTNCWENDQYKAKGLVSEIRAVVNVKDSFTRLQQEREKEQAKKTVAYSNRIKEIQKRAEEVDGIKKQFNALFGESNPHDRGKKLEVVLNALFKFYGILVREAFTRTGDDRQGIIEQIDGVIEIDNQIYLVEMKWRKDAIGSEDVYAHLGRIYHRSNAQGIFISASRFSHSGVTAAKEALLKNAILILTDLEEFINILDNDIDLTKYFKAKIRKAIIDKDPYTRP
jgi:restriction system protein